MTPPAPAASLSLGGSRSQRGLSSRRALTFFDPNALPNATPPVFNSTWEYVGPRNTTSANHNQFGASSFSGRVNAIAIDPTNSDTWYIGTARGGLFRLTNSGATCEPLSDADPTHWPHLEISSLAISYNASTGVKKIFVGTGDFPNNSGYGPGLKIGTVNNTDSTVTWNAFPLTNGTTTYIADISHIVVDPNDPNRITLTTGRGPWPGPGPVTGPSLGYLWQSLDGGGTWYGVNVQLHDTSIQELLGVWCDVECGPKDPNHGNVCQYYAAMYDSSGSRKVFTNLGPTGTWQEINEPTMSSFNAGDSASIAITPSTDPNQPQTVYLMEGNLSDSNNPPQGTQSRIFESINAGVTWSPIFGSGSVTDPTNRLFWTGGGKPGWDQAGYDLFLGSTHNSITGKDVLFAGLLDLLQGDPSGAGSWMSDALVYSTNDPPNYPTAGDQIHTDQHAFAAFPGEPSKMLVGNDGGLYLMTYDPSANTVSFTGENGSLPTMLMSSLACHPTNPNIVLGGTHDNGTIYGTSSTNWRAVTDSDGEACAINPTNPNIQYSTVQSLGKDYPAGQGFYRTDTSWATQPTDIRPDWGSEAIEDTAPVVLDPNNPNLLYAGTDHLWRRDDNQGGMWKGDLGTQALATGGNGLLSIAVAPSDSKRIYTGSMAGDLYMTTDAQPSNPDPTVVWSQSLAGGALPDLPIMAISVSPNDPNSILLGLGGTGTGTSHLWQGTVTTNPSISIAWKAMGPWTSDGTLIDIPVNTIARDPWCFNNTFYVGTDVGVLEGTYDFTNTTWYNATAPLSLKLPNVQVNSLQAVPGTGYLVAATYGRGIWRIPITPLPAPGPGHWHAADIAVDQSNVAHLLWSASDLGRWETWSLDASANVIYGGYLYGPYSSGERALRLDAGSSDNYVRLLVTDSNNAGELWLMGPDNASLYGKHSFSLPSPWGPLDIADSSDNKAKMLWYNSDTSSLTREFVKTIDNSFNATDNAGTGLDTWGVPIRIAAGADNVTRILWNNGGNASLWLENSSGGYTGQFRVTAPATDAYPLDVTVDKNNLTNILWTNGATVYITTVDNAGTQNPTPLLQRATYGWSPIALSAGSDGKLRLLWTLSDGRADVWVYDPGTGSAVNGGGALGPY